MSALPFLARHVQCYSQETEKWKQDHDEVMRNFDGADILSDAAAYGLFLLGRLRANRPTTFEQAALIHDHYLEWHATSLRLIRMIEASEAKGFTVDNDTSFDFSLSVSG